MEWDTTKGGADFSYQVGGSAVPEDTQAALYWSTSTNLADAIGGPVYSKDIPAGTAVGSYGPFNVSASQLGNPPQGAKYLLVVTDPNNVLGNFDPSQNVDAIAYTPEWTGDGSDNLWSDGNNWLGGFVPQAGDNLLFPTGAKQLSSENDLGYSFGSITIQDSYEFSGQTLTATGPVDVQQGSTVLDCSATDNGTTTVEAGASLTVGSGATLTTGGPTTVEADGTLAIGDGATLDVLSSDPLNVNGNLSLLTNSTCNIDGDASVANDGTLSAATGCEFGLASSSNFSLFGKATFDDGSNLTLKLNGNMNVEAGGELDMSGKAMLQGNTTTALGSTLAAGATSNTVVDGIVKYGGKTQFAPGSSVIYDATAQGEVVANGAYTSSGNQTMKLGSKWAVDGNAQWITQAGTVDLYGAVNSQGLCQLGLGANMNEHSGGVFNLASEFDCNGGKLTLEASQNAADGAKFILSSDANLFEKGGSVTVGFKDQLNNFGTVKVSAGIFLNQGSVNGNKIIDGDAITVAAGATLDVSGSLTEDAGGHLDVFGTVTIDSGASLSNFTTITIGAGGLLDVLGAISVSKAGSLDIFGTVNVAKGATYSMLGTATVEPGGALNLPQTPSSTNTALSVSASTPLAGVDPVTLTATVTGQGPSNGTPTGTVDFIDTTTGNDLGSAALVDGVASLNAGTFAVGTHTITSTYSGDSNFLSSSGTATLTAQTPASQPATAPTSTPPNLIQALTTLYLDGIEWEIETLLGDDTTAVQASLAANMPFAGPLGLFAEFVGIEVVLDALLQRNNT